MSYDFDALMDELRRDEGFVPHAYQDHLGYWTIGIGTLIDKRRGGGISFEQAKMLAADKVREIEAGLDDGIPWWRAASPARQRALANMAYQMGVAGLLKFRNTLAMAQAGRWNDAADNALKSKWARQTPERAKRVTDMLRRG